MGAVPGRKPILSLKDTYSAGLRYEDKISDFPPVIPICIRSHRQGGSISHNNVYFIAVNVNIRNNSGRELRH